MCNKVFQESKNKSKSTGNRRFMVEVWFFVSLRGWEWEEGYDVHDRAEYREVSAKDIHTDSVKYNSV